MGKVIDFIHATNEVLSGQGVHLPTAAQATTTPATRAEQGRAVQERIVGVGRVECMYASAAADDRQALISVLIALLPFIGYPRTLNALAAINEAAPAAPEGQ
jgi:hypothetical protein